MTVRERVRSILERVVIQLWLCAALLSLIKLASPAEAPLASTALTALPSLCSPQGNEASCFLSENGASLAVAEDPGAFYLATCAASPPCSAPFLRRRNAPESLEQALGELSAACPAARLERPGKPSPTLPPDCGAVDTPTIFLVSEDTLVPAMLVLAGPFDEQGKPAPEKPLPPELTLLPAANLDRALERLVRLSERISDVPDRTNYWTGGAGHGWLVFPLTGFSPAPEDFGNAIHLLGRVARAVVPPPRPTPVLVDLAGLSPCPAAEDVKSLVEALSSLGLAAVGHNLAGESAPFKLLEGHALQGRVLSVAVTSTEAACQTLPSVPPGKLIAWFQSQVEDPPPEQGLTVVLLHWKDPALSSVTRTALVRGLVDAGASVVAGIENGPPGPIEGTPTGLSVQNLGSLLSSAGIIPGSAAAAGIAVQCFRTASRTSTCRTVPVASSLGFGIPIVSPECSACALLPHGLFDRLYR